MNIYRYSILLILFFVVTGCQKKDTTFVIDQGQVGPLLKGTLIYKLDSIYARDSLVKVAADGDFTYSSKDRYMLYDKNANHLLTLTPTKLEDSTEVIENIRIYDERYITNKGVSVKSAFKDIRNNYKISRITNSINNILVFVDEIDAYFVIDKKELPESLRYNMSIRIEEVQIPDEAKIKYFMIGWQ